MGYSTDFNGKLTFSQPLSNVQENYLKNLNQTRRMKRDVQKLMKLYKGKHGAPFIGNLSEEQKNLIKQLTNSGLKVSYSFVEDNRTPEEIYGNDGEFFAKDDGNSGQTTDNSIIDHNTPPGQVGYNEKGDFNYVWDENQRRSKEGLCQPGLWCGWTVNSNSLFWDGGEKFYSYIEWLKYLINKFFIPWGITLNGEIEWEGEESSDFGKIVVTDNEVTVLTGKKVFE